MSTLAFVDGQEGTTGLRIHEYLAQRRDIEVLRIDPEKRKDTSERARLLNAANVAFLCLPDVAAKEAAALVTNPGTCLIEGVNLSVGRGTAKPFEWLGAPWIDGLALADTLNRMALPGVRWRAVGFQPCSGPHAGMLCQGVQPHVSDPDALQAVLAGVGLLAALQQLHGDKLRWNEQHFDRLAGSPALRAAIAGGAAPLELAAAWQAYEDAFRQRAASFLLYN